MSNTYQFDTGIDIADEYLQTICGAEIKLSTARTRQSCLRSFARYLERENLSIFSVSVGDVKDFLRDRVRQGLSQITIDHSFSAVKSLYRYIRIETELEADIDLFSLQNIDTNSFNTPNPPDQEPLDEEELKRLIDAANNRRDRLMMVVDGKTGARNQSLRNIKLDQVDLEEKEIELENTKTGGTYVIPISNNLALELERWIQVERPSYATAADSDYLFPSIRGEKIESEAGFGRIVKEAAERAGIQEVIAKREYTKGEKRKHGVTEGTIEYYRVTPHTLRHTFSHLLNKAGLDTEMRKEALDHTDMSTTRKHYTFDQSDYKSFIRELFHEN